MCNYYLWVLVRSLGFVVVVVVLGLRLHKIGSNFEFLLDVRSDFLDLAFAAKWFSLWCHETKVFKIQINGTVKPRDQRGPDWTLKVVEVKSRRLVRKFLKQIFLHQWIHVVNHFSNAHERHIWSSSLKFFFFFSLSVVDDWKLIKKYLVVSSVVSVLFI